MSVFDDLGLFQGYFISTFGITRNDISISNFNPGVYKITCQKNNKIYIGKSEKNVYWRVYDNVRSIVDAPQKNKELYNDIMTYGLDNFKFEIIAFCKNPKNASNIEELLIADAFHCNPSLLYNKNTFKFKVRITRKKFKVIVMRNIKYWLEKDDDLNNTTTVN